MPDVLQIDFSNLPDKKEAKAPGEPPTPPSSSPLDFSGLPDKQARSSIDPVTGKPYPQIRQAPDAPFLQPLWDLLRASPAERSAKAATSLALADEFNISPSEAYQHHDALTKAAGIRGVPTAKELTGMMFVPPIAAGLATAPAATLLGLGGYMALSEVESAAVSLIKGKPYKAFQEKGMSNLLPDESSQLAVDIVDLLDVIGKGMVVGAGFKHGPKLVEWATKEVINTYNLPKDLYVNAAELKAEMQTGGVMDTEVFEMVKSANLTSRQWRQAVTEGMIVRIPAERITTWRDRPWFAKVKGLLRIAPFQRQVVTQSGKAGVERPVAGLLEGPTKGQAGAKTGPSKPVVAPEALPPEAPDQEIAAAFDSAVTQEAPPSVEKPTEPAPQEVKAPEAPDVPEIPVVINPPEAASAVPSDVQENHARLVEEAVKFVEDNAPELVPEMVDRITGAGYDELTAKVYASTYIGLKRLGQMNGMTDEQIKEFAMSNLPNIIKKGPVQKKSEFENVPFMEAAYRNYEAVTGEKTLARVVLDFGGLKIPDKKTAGNLYEEYTTDMPGVVFRTNGRRADELVVDVQDSGFPQIQTENDLLEALKEEYRVLSQGKEFYQSPKDERKGKKSILFHGTNAQFEVFDLTTSKAFGASKFGHWFTEDMEFAKSFGARVMMAEVIVINPKIISANEWDKIRSDHAKDGQWFATWKKELQQEGHDGLRVEGGTGKLGRFDVRNPTIIAAFDDAQIKILPTTEFLQAEHGQPRGKITFGKNAIDITLFAKSDPSSIIHETGHFYLKMMGDLAAQESATPELKESYYTVLDWLGVKTGEQITTEHHEKFARGMEAYFYEGKSPSSKMAAIFEQIKQWLRTVYKSIKDLNVELSPKVRKVFDRLFATPEELAVLDRIEHAQKAGEKFTTKGLVRETTGQVNDQAPPISELAQLKFAYVRAAQAARAAFRAGNKEGVAKEKARMADILARAKSSKDARAIVRNRIKEAKKIKKKAVGRIAVDYQKKIRDLFEGVDLTKPTEATAERLRGLSEFLAREGVPLGISQAEINQLERLNKIPFRDLSGEAQQVLLDTAQKLYDLGKLKRELQQKKEWRKLAVELEKLVASTENLDPTLSGEERPTQTDNMKTATLKADIATLHSFRVADRLDGSADYAGENARLVKEQIKAEVKARSQSQERMNRVTERFKALGLKGLDPEMAKRINVVLMVEQNARGQAGSLIEKYGMREVPTLTPQERSVLNILRDEAGAKTAEIKAVYEKRENLPFPEVRNYFPIVYPKDVFGSPLDAIDPDRYRTRQVAQGFTKERLPRVEESPRDELLAVLDHAIVNQEWYINMQPILDRQASLIRTPEFKDASGDVLWNWWKDQIDIVARKGWKAQAEHQPLLRDIRMNLNKAILGYKLSSTMMQPFAVFDAMAYAGSHFGVLAGGRIFWETLKAWSRLRKTMGYVRTTPELEVRNAGEIAIEETLQQVKGVEGLKAKLVRGSLAPLKFADVVTATGVEKGFVKILEGEGLSPEAAKAEAAFLMELVSGSSQVSARPHILAEGEMWRTILTFQTFFLNRWGIVSHDIIRSGMKGNWKRRALSLLALSLMIAGGMAEDEARKAMYELTTGEKSKMPDEDWIRQVLLYIPRQVPIVGRFFEGQAVEPPTLRAGKQAATGISQVAQGKPVAGFEKIAESVLSAWVGMPGTAQAFDLLDRELSDIKRHEAEAARRRNE